jgi:DNA-binding NtrC family response regulator
LEDRILIVDDEAMICNLPAQRLTKEGYSCVTTHSGKEAPHHFCKDPFSLIICDIKMPEMDGIELLKKVEAVHPDMLMIMVTAYPDIDLALEAMCLGAHDFIIKPVDLELVILNVKKAL